MSRALALPRSMTADEVGNPDPDPKPESPPPPAQGPSVHNRWEAILRRPAAAASWPGTIPFRSPFDPDPDELGRRIRFSEYNLFLIGAAQVLFFLGFAVVWWYLGAALPQAGAGIAAGLLIAAGLDLLALWALRTGRQGRRWDTLWWLKAACYPLSFLLAMLISTAIGSRIWGAKGVHVLVALGLQTAIWWVSHWAEASGKTHGLPWPWLGLTLVLAPGFGGWAVASFPLGSDEHSVRRWIAEHRGAPRLAARDALGRCQNPLVDDSVRVAVTLSGGGYRAALAHAGLLAGFDAQCVPVHVLSTVSGGSIVGAAYALGVPPAEFAARLSRRKPGLPTAVVSMRSVLLDLWAPTWNIAETYREHFEGTFFGSATLADLPRTPLLLVNATDPEAGILDAREVFFRGRAPRLVIDGQSLDQHVRVADVVAASGAFPGAFRPKSVPWPERGDTTQTATKTKDRKFLDGGIIDNLGVEGLRRYLTISDLDGQLPVRPHVMILSDASGYGSPQSIDAKADIASLLQRSTDYSYEALHRHLYARSTGRDNLLEWIRSRQVAEQTSVVPYAQIDSRLHGGDPSALVTVAIPMTASVMQDILVRYPSCRGEDGEDGRAIQRRVSALSTLYELEPKEVRDAFWLGYALATIYRPAIVCAGAIATGRTCALPPAEVKSDQANVQCRSLNAVLSAPVP